MNIYEKLLAAGEYSAAGLFEQPGRGLFFRKALALRRYFEHAGLSEYKGGRLYPSGGQYFIMSVVPDYYFGFRFNRALLEQRIPGEAGEIADKIEAAFFRWHSTVPAEHTVAGNMWTHSMPNYPRIAAEGLDSYAARAENVADADLREGLLHLLEGLRCYVSRILDYLRSVNADERLIRAYEQVPFQPARDIYEAVVCRNFLYYIDNCDNMGCLASDLMPYYKGENIVDLLRELFDNMDITNGYSMSLGVDYSPLTVQCLEAVKGKRRPMIELFIDENCPDEVWNTALDAVRTNGGQPAFYNHKAVIGGLKKRFPQLTTEDAEHFCGGGCTEAMIAGCSNVGSLDAGINLLLILKQVMGESLTDCGSFGEFYDRFLCAVSDVVDHVTREIANSQKSRAELNPLPMRTLLIDDCIDRGIEYNNGGARYMWSIINFAGTINVIDSMLVIEDYIYENGKLTAEKMLELLDAGDEAFLDEVGKYPHCFGVDDAHANELAHRLTDDVFSMLDDKMPFLGMGFLPASIQFTSAPTAGKYIGCTPDGRHAGAPLCESLGPISEKDVKGPTAMLSSVTSLSLERALGIPVVNITINPDFKNSILRSLIRGYLDKGGMQLQITCVSKKMLEEAYADPTKHRNLIIRVGGYSEYFHRLTDDQKRLVLSRIVH